MIKVIAIIHFISGVFGIYAMVGLVGLQPSHWGSISLGTTIALFAYTPHTITFTLSGIGLWLGQRWGWFVVLFICTSSLYSRLKNFLAIPTYSEQLLALMLRPISIINSVISLAIVIGTLWFFLHPRVHVRFKPIVRRWLALVVIVIIVIVYREISSMWVKSYIEWRETML